MFSASGITFGNEVLNNGTYMLLVDGRSCLETIRQLHMKCDLEFNQEQTYNFLVSREDKVAISEAERVVLLILSSNIA